MSTQNPDITANNIVEKLANEVKLYSNEPIYLIDFGRDYCFIEILVNDILVYKAFDNPTSSTAVEINHAIFKSGTQKVTFRLYPAGKINSENGANLRFNMHTSAYLNPEVYDKISNNGITLKKYNTSKILNTNKEESPDSIFIATGKNYYEDSFSFEAEVPYQLEAFEKAQDLRKLDRKELETKLLKKYQEVWSMYQNKEYDNIARISFDNLKNEVISFYYTEKDINAFWNQLLNAYKLNSFQMQPLENYEVKFFAEGKLVAFITKSQEFWARGNTALWAEFDRGEGIETLFCNRYFYIPEGETEFKVY